MGSVEFTGDMGYCTSQLKYVFFVGGMGPCAGHGNQIWDASISLRPWIQLLPTSPMHQLFPPIVSKLFIYRLVKQSVSKLVIKLVVLLLLLLNRNQFLLLLTLLNRNQFCLTFFRDRPPEKPSSPTAELRAGSAVMVAGCKPGDCVHIWDCFTC